MIRHKKHIARMKWNAKISNSSITNPKSFWKLFNTTKSTITNSISKSEWESYFSRLYKNQAASTSEEPSPPNIHQNVQSVNSSDIPDITTLEIKEAINKLKAGKAPGPDGITNEVLKALPDNWIHCLMHLFNRILQCAEYPEKWAESIIKPIFKSGDKNRPNNYRGISLISCVSKLFSSILVNRISAWAENNSIICEEQFGFRRGRRTTDAVFILTSLIQKQILKRNFIVVLLT